MSLVSNYHRTVHPSIILINPFLSLCVACLSICWSVYPVRPPVCLSIHRSVCLTVHLSVCTICPPVYVSVCLPTCLSVCPVCPLFYLSLLFVHLSVCSVCLSIFPVLSAHLRLSIHLSVWMSVCLSDLSDCLSTSVCYLSISPVHPPTCLSICQSPFCLSVCFHSRLSVQVNHQWFGRRDREDYG